MEINGIINTVTAAVTRTDNYKRLSRETEQPFYNFVKTSLRGIIFYMKIYIGSDHAGYKLKEKLKAYMQSLNIEVADKGAFSLDHEDDYPDFIVPVAEAVAKDNESLGIILGGSGQGEQISANKIDGIRAIEFYGGNLEIVKLGREHNNANILSLGARFITEDEAKNAILLFMNTPFTNDERHVRRINKINEEEINN